MHNNNKTGPRKQGCLGASYLKLWPIARSSVGQVQQRTTTAGLRPRDPDDKCDVTLAVCQSLTCSKYHR